MDMIPIKRDLYVNNGKIVKVIDGTLGFVCPTCGEISFIPTYLKYETDVNHESEEAIFPVFRVKCLHCEEKFNTIADYDPNIVYILYDLNRKGYKTVYSCEGHVDSCGISLPYISFADKTICDTIAPPTGWVWTNDSKKVLTLYYDMSDEAQYKILDDFNHNSITEDWKEQAFIDLATWVSDLPAKSEDITFLLKSLKAFEQNGVFDNFVY